jgi:hypothetical protein
MLAEWLRCAKRLSEAEPISRRALQIDENHFGENHPRVAMRLNNFGLLLQKSNRSIEAEPLYRRALAINENHFGKDHPHLHAVLSNLGSLLAATNRVPEAELLLRRRVDILMKSTHTTGKFSNDLQHATWSYGKFLQTMGLPSKEILGSLQGLCQRFGLDLSAIEEAVDLLGFCEPSRVIDFDLMNRIADVGSPEHRQFKRFSETAGPQGVLSIWHALDEFPIDGLIGLINAVGSLDDRRDLIQLLAKTSLFLLSTPPGARPSLLLDRSPTSTIFVCAFTRKPHWERWLRSNPDDLHCYPLEMKMREIFTRAIPERPFGLRLNAGSGVFEILLPPEAVDQIRNVLGC